MTIVIEHPEYQATRERMSNDGLIQIMALEIAGAVKSGDVDIDEWVTPDGKPRFRMIRECSRQYRLLCERDGKTPDGGHIGAVAEAMILVWQKGTAAGVDWFPTFPREQVSA